ncbi:MAG: hypothetical protein K6F13_05050 [Lachnospiraceae bacterium]|nr:hypothetical protein [Lachnospiraceae bacterium]
MKFRKILALGLAAALAVGSLAACGGSDSGNGGGAADSGSAAADDGAAGAATSGGTLNVAMAFDGTIGTVADSYSSCWSVMRYGISEALTKVASDGSIVGWLASDWSINGDDASEWTFNIRDDVYFSNGTQLTPSLVVDAINYLYDANDPANGGADALTPFMVRPAEITADDAAGTVTFKFDAPVYNVAGALSNPAFGIINWAESEEYEIGTGPYVPVSVTEGHSVSLVRNEYYYEPVPFDEVNLMAMADSSAESYALQDGSVDVAFNLAASDLSILEGAGFNVNIASGARDGFFWINLDSTLGNEVLRKAVLTAVDWQTIDEITVGGSYVYGWTLLAPSYSQYGGASMANPYAYDPAAAEAMLDEAGIVDNDGDGIRELNGENIEINVVTNTSRQMDVLADAMVPMLQDIGIGAVHNLTDDQVEVCASGAYDLVCWNQVVMQTGDPSNFLYQWDSDNTGSNYSRYNNPEYNALYDQLIQTADADEAAGIVQQMQQMLLDDGAYMMAGYYNFNSANSSNVTGVVTNGTADYYWITNDIAPAQ